MAVEKTIKINVDEKEAEKNTNKLIETLDKLNDTLDKTGEAAKEGMDDTTKAAKKTDTAVKGANKSVKAVGTSLKAIGIGLVIALVAKLTEVFSRNQKVVDFFSTSMETLTIAFTDLFNFVFDNFGKWVDAIKGVFENPKETLIELGNSIRDNVIERFVSLSDTLKLLFEAFQKFKSGDVSGAFDTLKEAGKESIDIFTGVDNTLDKVVETTKNVVQSVTEYTKNTIEAAKANVQLKNTAQLAAAQQQLLVEKYDILAEKQRQLRDEERNSISERIKANNELKEVLDQQEKAMLGAANAQIAAAKATLSTNDNIENQVALTEALANKQGVLAQIEGFRSEQLVNDLALKREQVELDNSINDAEKQRQLDKLDFEIELAKNEDEKLVKQQERLDLENEIILEDLQRKRELYKEGTQLREDAEQEYLDKKQEIDQQGVLLDKKANKDKEQSAKALEDSKIQMATVGLSILGQLAKEGSALAKGVAVSQAIISTYQGINKALAETTDPTPSQSLRFANAAAVGVAGFLNVASILKTNESSDSSASATTSSSGTSAPSFNLVEDTASNQIAGSVQSSTDPIKAYVVSEDVTTGQDLDNEAVNGASI